MSQDVYVEVVAFGGAGSRPAYRLGPAERFYGWPIVVDPSLASGTLLLEPFNDSPDAPPPEVIGG
jgi:hypothetical protein